MAERIDEVEAVALAEFGEAAGAVADDLYEEGEGAGLGVGVVDGDGTAEHDAGASVDLHLDELAGGYGLEGATVCEEQGEVATAELLAA